MRPKLTFKFLHLDMEDVLVDPPEVGIVILGLHCLRQLGLKAGDDVIDIILHLVEKFVICQQPEDDNLPAAKLEPLTVPFHALVCNGIQL